uniref:ZP domain-containing protein n=1 Tax=Syphacia muris TaxID=451379 RepID=A0A0N5AWP3_9BILA
MISLTFQTKKPFTGRIYVRGLADNNRCSRSFSKNTNKNKFSMVIQTGDCPVKRRRFTGTAKGIMFSLTIVISFHGTFVTKYDKAYRCMCLFHNIKHLSSQIDMKSLNAADLIDVVRTPRCTYTIRRDNSSGPQVVYGIVGEKIYHVWECDNPNYGFLVHSCFVNDTTTTTRFDLIDIDGCAIDPIIQPDVEYLTNSSRAVVKTFGYKFSDTSVLNYHCVLELCKKSTGECDGLTPPQCQKQRRSIRSDSCSFIYLKLELKQKC